MWGCIIEAALSLAAIFLMAVLQKFAVGRVLMALSAASWIPLILACQPWSASQMSYESVALLPWCALTAFGVLNQRYFSYASPIAAIYYCTVTWCVPSDCTLVLRPLHLLLP